MAVYNGEKYIKEAVDSILNQTYPNFELIVVDDGSEDNTCPVLQSYGEKIQVFKLPHRGKSAALNFGITKASGDFIALMDSDDVALPDRFARQVKFLSDHPDVGVVSGAALLIDGKGKKVGFADNPLTDIEIRWKGLLYSPVINTSAMIRADLISCLEFLYDETYPCAEDYELWQRLLVISHFANLAEEIIHIRIHNKSVMSTMKEICLQKHMEVSRRMIRSEIPECAMSDEEIKQLVEIINLGFNVRKELRARRARSALNYLDLWDQFKVKYRNDKYIGKIQSAVALKAARMVLLPMFQKGLFQGIRRLNSVDPQWFSNFARSLIPWLGYLLNIRGQKKLRE